VVEYIQCDRLSINGDRTEELAECNQSLNEVTTPKAFHPDVDNTLFNSEE
jgi:hypothetical protein